MKFSDRKLNHGLNSNQSSKGFVQGCRSFVSSFCITELINNHCFWISALYLSRYPIINYYAVLLNRKVISMIKRMIEVYDVTQMINEMMNTNIIDY